MNDPAVREGLNQMGVATAASQEKWVEENLERGAKSEPEVVEFTVYDRADAAPVGTVGLLDIVHAHGTAEFAIALGERRGQGLGTEATRLVLDYAFHVLQLRNVLLETLEWNAAGIAAYERAGFRRIGVRRGARISRGRPTDVVLMDAIRRISRPGKPAAAEARGRGGGPPEGGPPGAHQVVGLPFV